MNVSCKHPMTLDVISHNSFVLLFRVVRILFWPIALIVLLQSATFLEMIRSAFFGESTLASAVTMLIQTVLSIAFIPVYFIACYLMIYTSDALWKNKAWTLSLSLGALELIPIIKSFVVTIWIGLVTLVFIIVLAVVPQVAIFLATDGIFRFVLMIVSSLILIIPPLLYFFNRALAPYIVLIELVGMRQALRTSKALMTQKAWYSLSGPLTRYIILAHLIFALPLVGYLTSLVAALLSYGFERIPTEVLLLQIFFGVVGFILSLLAVALSSLLIVGFYYDLKARLHLHPLA